MKKKILVLVLALMMAGVSACSAGNKATTNTESKQEDTKAEETKTEDTKQKETKAEDTKQEDTKAEDTKAEETKTEDTKQKDTKAEDTKTGESKKEEAKKADSKKDEVKFPEFTAKTVTGEDISSDVFKDSKLTVVNVWGSWCGPCVREIPELQKLYENMKDKNVNVIGLAQDAGSDMDAVKEVIEKNNVTYQNIVPEGVTEGFVMSLMAFPTTFFVDSEGNIVGSIQGARDLDGFTKIVEDLLANQA